MQSIHMHITQIFKHVYIPAIIYIISYWSFKETMMELQFIAGSIRWLAQSRHAHPLFPANFGPGLKFLLSLLFWETNTNQLELARDETGLPSHEASPCMDTDLPYAILDVSNGSLFMLRFPSVLKVALLFGYLPLKQFPI